MSIRLLEADALRRDLAQPDLTDPASGPHALQALLDDIERAAGRACATLVQRHRAHPVVPVASNYDRLRYGPDAVARDARYSRYVTTDTMLRAHTSAMIPPLLERLAADPPVDVVLSCPGLVYRRDVIDRRHVGEPHQLDLWRIRTSPPALGPADLEELLAAVLDTALPGRRYRTVPAQHPYTTHGLQVDVADGDDWVEVAECGVAHLGVLAAAGLDGAATSGLALGLGLDRLLMLRKGIDDIRLLRSSDPRVRAQLRDLAPYRPVSAMPPVRRDLSLAVGADRTAEELGDRVREVLGADAVAVEHVEVVSETPADALPPAARRRLGIRAGQKNVLLRIVLRHLDRTLTDAEANRLRDVIAAALHEGEAPG